MRDYQYLYSLDTEQFEYNLFLYLVHALIQVPDTIVKNMCQIFITYFFGKYF